MGRALTTTVSFIAFAFGSAYGAAKAVEGVSPPFMTGCAVLLGLLAVSMAVITAIEWAKCENESED